jgi:hypothetical protein
MDVRPNTKLRKVSPFAFNQGAALRLIAGFLLPLLWGGGLLLTGCRDRTSVGDTGGTTAPQVTAPDEVGEQGTVPEAVPDTTAPTEPTTTSETANDTPNTALQAQQDTALPDALTRQWEPASSVLFTFGPMTITPNEVQWSSGQSSAYTLVSTEGGYLLELESSPSFYDTPNPFIKLIPKIDESGSVTSMDIAFYESQSKVDSEEYIMYGSYFVE